MWLRKNRTGTASPRRPPCDAVFNRFTAGKARTLWYCGVLAEASEQRLHNVPFHELSDAVAEADMHRLSKA